MRVTIFILLFIGQAIVTHALLINEVMSNPIGDDGGREWIELYNNTDTDVDISSLTLSIKGGPQIIVTPVSGGTLLRARMYAIVASTVSGATKFTQDYPGYNGPLFKSAISLVNTGVTSVEVKMQGVIMDTLSSYTAAKEGNTYSLVNGTFTSGSPTPGEENKEVVVTQSEPTTTTSQGTQTVIPQASAPSADIIMYLPKDKIVVAGAPALFSVSSHTHEGKAIENMIYHWSFGDGGQRTGSSTIYRYLYPGYYITQVEGGNGLIAGTGRMNVRVVAPDISITSIGQGKYGPYIDITNPNAYDLDISDWKLTLDGAAFPFPKNTLITKGTTRFSGIPMGFASTTVSSSTTIKILFPTMEEVVRVNQGGDDKKEMLENNKKVTPIPVKNLRQSKGEPLSSSHDKNLSQTYLSSSSLSESSSTKILPTKRDTRIAGFLRSLFIR